jgi:hypothetical protein
MRFVYHASSAILSTTANLAGLRIYGIKLLAAKLSMLLKHSAFSKIASSSNFSSFTLA